MTPERTQHPDAGEQTREVGMETASRMRAMASLCRQIAAYHPDRSWKLLGEAEYWEHMASAALLEQFKESARSDNLLQPPKTGKANDPQGKIAVA